MVIMLIFLLGTLGMGLMLTGRRSASIACWLLMLGLMGVSMAYHMTDTLKISL